MDITPAIPPGRMVIQRYGPGEFTLSAGAGPLRHQGPMIIFGEQAIAWPVGELAALTLADFALVTGVRPAFDLLLVGTGATGRPLPAALGRALRAVIPGIEAMATGAACRTYNVLITEERRVVAALFPV